MRIAWPAIFATALAACSGGGRPPTLALPNADQYAVQHHPLDYDVSQGGRTFTAADDRKLRYEIELGAAARGVRVEGTHVVGAPETLDPIEVSVQAYDSAGLSVNDEFVINVSINGAPRVTQAHADVLVKAGAPVALDAMVGTGQFIDPEGDPIRYGVTLRGFAGMSVNGTQVSGRLGAVGAVEVTLTAIDAYGASGKDVFLIAVAGPLPSGVPHLPATAYSYTNDSLPDYYREPGRTFDTELAANKTTDAGAALGRVLFHDKRLSITNTVACSSCHQQAHGFASDRRFDAGAIGVPLTRQAMPLANVRFNKTHAWLIDMRVTTLEEAARNAIESPEELGMQAELLEEKLRATSFYPPLFEAAFGTPEISEERVLQALGQFLQSLVSYRARLDLAGPPGPQEKRGREIFTGAAGIDCSSCHDPQLGTLRWGANNGLDAARTVVPVAFRAAALRNIALTAPYMHDGRFATLREVIDHYDHGIQENSNLHTLLRDEHGKPRRMNLPEADKQALEAFLRSFTDEPMLADPRFSNPWVPGGESGE